MVAVWIICWAIVRAFSEYPLPKLIRQLFKNLLHAVEQIPSGEAGRFPELFSMLLDVLAVHRANPKRKEFMNCYAGMLMQSIIYAATLQ